MMSMEQEAVRAAASEKFEEQQLLEDMAAEQEPQNAGLNFDFSFLLSKTGEGPIESYVEHPLNYRRSKGMAQILRGATGMLGALDLAIIDIGLGTMNMMKEGKTDVTE